MESVQRYLPVRNRLGEGPLWHAAEQALYWVDIEGMAYHRHVPATGEQERVEVGRLIGRDALPPAGRDGHGDQPGHPVLGPGGRAADPGG